MQIYLFQNGKQEGPFGLPRIAARLVSGDLDSATPAWRRHGGLASAESSGLGGGGDQAPPPKVVAAPAEEEIGPANEPTPSEAEPVASELTGDPDQEEETKRPVGI